MHVLVVGDGPVAEALGPMASVLGWTSATATSLADAEDGLDAADAVVVTSHHEDLDGPAIRAALAHGTSYVGAMGSRRTQARRREWLLGRGVTEEQLGALHAPVGLDIGADDPGEIAVSILAEIIAERRGAGTSVASISDREGAIHPDQEPGSAYCPGG
ncbi:MAG TPA: XdhC family protein [Nocardioides sp.]|nr:XdhC family protein [Nocardioides sp.]